MDWGDEGGFINEVGGGDEPHAVGNSVTLAGEDKNKAIAAVSVSQIVKLTRPNEGLVISGKKIYHVNLVAMVYEIVDISPNKIHVLVDDYTSGGPLEVTHIIGDAGGPGDDSSMGMYDDNMDLPEDQPRSLSSIKVGDYIRCIGVVKFNQDKSNLVAYNARIIENPNEVTVHALEVIRDSLHYERCQNSSSAQPSAESGYTNTGNAQAAKNEFGTLSTREKHILKFLKERAPGKGVHVNDIVQNFKAFSRQDVDDSLGILNSEGLCWQGDSEEIWRVD